MEEGFIPCENPFQDFKLIANGVEDVDLFASAEGSEASSFLVQVSVFTFMYLSSKDRIALQAPNRIQKMRYVQMLRYLQLHESTIM